MMSIFKLIFLLIFVIILISNQNKASTDLIMTPKFLNPNDTIHILSPSGAIEPSLIEGAKKVFTSWNLKVTEGDFARSIYGRFSGTKDQRISDLQNAMDNPEIKAILCSRGGYGLSQIIDKLDFTQFLKTPKWFIGFSDITILHNALNNKNIASIHAVMAKQLTELPDNSLQIILLRDILFGKLPVYSIESHPLNRNGVAQGQLIGGNLSVLLGMRATMYDLKFKNKILFIEDIDEKPYHIDRMMQNLRLSGVLANISGLIIGQFSDCDEDNLMKQSISELIFDSVKDYNYPVCFNFPSGHVDYNLPIILGEKTVLNVNDDVVVLKY